MYKYRGHTDLNCVAGPDFSTKTCGNPEISDSVHFTCIWVLFEEIMDVAFAGKERQTEHRKERIWQSRGSVLLTGGQ